VVAIQSPQSSLLEAIGRVVLVVVSQDGGPPLKKRVALDVVVVVVVGALPEVSPVLVSSHGDVVQRAGEGLAARRADYYPTINEVPAPFDGQKRVARRSRRARSRHSGRGTRIRA